jgi:hypothetical protein
MTAMPPEPDLGPQWPTSMTPEPPAYPPPAYPQPQQDMVRRRRGMSVLRIACGILWAVIAVICAIGAVLEWTIGLHAAAVLCFVIAVGSGWYDYRVWTFKARRIIL